MCAVLEDDVSYRVAAQMNGGLYALLEDLHPEVSLEGNLLRVDKPQHTSATYEAHAMTLTPSVFAWPGLILDDGQGDRFGLTYAARGVARVWEGLTAMDRIDDEPLAALLGRTRAAILEMTAVPLSTTQIAHELGPEPGVGEPAPLRAAGEWSRRQPALRPVRPLPADPARAVDDRRPAGRPSRDARDATSDPPAPMTPAARRSCDGAT